MIHFDHIAIGCSTLEQGAQYMLDRCNIVMPQGGEHTQMGTHNLLMATGSDTFLEVIAINRAAESPQRKRWFGLDEAKVQTRFAQTAKPYACVWRSDNLEQDIETAKSLGIDLGKPVTLTRGDLSWRFAVRDDGSIPLDATAPMIMQWPNDGPHPASHMKDLGLRVKQIKIASPHAKTIKNLLNQMAGDQTPITIEHSETSKLTATVSLPDGTSVTLD